MGRTVGVAGLAFPGGVGRGVAVLAQRYTELAVKDGGFILTTWYCS